MATEGPSQRVRYLLVAAALLGVLLWWYFSSYDSSLDQTETSLAPGSPHSIIEAGPFTPIWELRNVYIPDDWMHPRVAAFSGNVYLLGRLEYQDPFGVVALDPLLGSVLWKNDLRSASAIQAIPDGVVVGTCCIVRLTMLDEAAGDVVWSRHFFSNGVLYLGLRAPLLSANLGPDSFYALDTTSGETVRRYGFHDSSPIYLLDGTTLYTRRPSSDSIQSYDTASRSPIWTTRLGEAYFSTPQFTDQAIFILAGRPVGQLFAINRASGTTLWQTGRDVLSMTAPVGKYVYYLTEAGYLVQAEADTGEVEARLSFSLPFPSDPVDPGGYYLTVEPDTSTLIVYLGDSQQLFAFKLDDGA